MKADHASATAQGVAFLRAAHQIIDGEPPILRDPVIVRLLGPDTEQRVRQELERLQSPPARALRSHVALRSRVAEDSLADAVARGAQQYVVLGAGLDTFAYRQPEWARGLAIIEVDHPASQEAKRAALDDAGIEIPPNVHYAGVDFETETLAAGLRRCGVSVERPTFFSWLGVTMYLTREAIDAVLATVASFPRNSEIVLTFAQPRDESDPRSGILAERAAKVGEPWLSYFELPALETVLRGHGFSDVRFLDHDEAFQRYYADRSDGLLPRRRISICTARR